MLVPHGRLPVVFKFFKFRLPNITGETYWACVNNKFNVKLHLAMMKILKQEISVVCEYALSHRPNCFR